MSNMFNSNYINHDNTSVFKWVLPLSQSCLVLYRLLLSVIFILDLTRKRLHREEQTDDDDSSDDEGSEEEETILVNLAKKKKKKKKKRLVSASKRLRNQSGKPGKTCYILCEDIHVEEGMGTAQAHARVCVSHYYNYESVGTRVILTFFGEHVYFVMFH